MDGSICWVKRWMGQPTCQLWKLPTCPALVMTWNIMLWNILLNICKHMTKHCLCHETLFVEDLSVDTMKHLDFSNKRFFFYLPCLSFLFYNKNTFQIKYLHRRWTEKYTGKHICSQNLCHKLILISTCADGSPWWSGMSCHGLITLPSPLTENMKYNYNQYKKNYLP